MLQGEEAFHPDDDAFWCSYFLDPFRCLHREDFYDIFDTEVDVRGDDEADEGRRGLDG
jgi:hypothetical protein